MATMGCKNGLILALMSLIDPGDEVIVEDPCFVSYAAAIRAVGGREAAVPLLASDRFRWRAENLDAAVTDRSKCLLFCSPQNPTGTVHTQADLETIAACARKHKLWVIVDEIYERITWHGRRHRCIRQLPGMRERTIGLMGFTKTFSMGGWRIGFAYAPEAVITAMTTLQQHLMTCAGSFTQTGAAAAIQTDYPPEVHRMWQDWERRCDTVCDHLNQLPGLSCARPEGGFYAWIDVTKTGMSSEQFVTGLLQEKNVALVAGSAFGTQGEGYVRMTSVKSWEDLHEGLHRIEDWLAGR